MKIDIIRVEEAVDGTFGVLLIEGKAYCVTLELPDKSNQPNVSNIPPGKYVCSRYSSSNFPNTWQIKDVPNREYILFHAGNTTNDSRGCVLLGQYFGKLRGSRAILNSGATFKEFMMITRLHNQLDLTIKEV